MALQNKKSLGQHWLKDRQILDEIAELTLGSTAQLCVEIGPGLGFLTSSLLRLYRRVIAVEYDKKLADNLPKSFPGKNLDVVNADFLDCDLESIPEPYVVAGNIPYYITSPIIMKLLAAKNKPTKIVLLIQKEVAERIVAKSGKHTILSLSVQNQANVSLGPIVEREYFTPPPKVDSMVIILEPKTEPTISSEALELARKAFSSPRKKLVKNLSSFYSSDLIKTALVSLGISVDVRPADIPLEDWQSLKDALE